MALQYKTSDGDTVDLICWKHYGSTEGRIVEQLLDANPGLADAGPLLPAGVDVVLPDFPTPAANDAVRLWD